MSDELTWPWKQLQDAGRGAVTLVMYIAGGVRRGWAGVLAWCRTTGAKKATSAWRGVWGAWREGVLPLLRRHALVLGVGAVLILVLLALWKLPQWQVADLGIQGKERFEQENKARTTLAQIGGGMFILIGLYLTLHRVQAAERTVQVAEEGQVTERFTRAIEQLGSDSLQIRLGGIYALERIARDSARDHWLIMEVRERVAWDDVPLQMTDTTPPTDIQAILTVLGLRTRWYGNGEDQRLDLRKTHIRGANLQHAHLEGVNFTGAHLEEANLQGAQLREVVLREAHLEGADLRGANLKQVHLGDAYLKGASLRGAHLEGADLTDAVGLTREQIAEAHIDDRTILPDYLKGDDRGN